MVKHSKHLKEDYGNCYFNKSQSDFVKALASKEFANMMNEGQDLYTFDPAHRLPDGTYTGCTIGINGYDESIYLQYVFDPKGFINCAKKELENTLRHGSSVPKAVAQKVLDEIVNRLSMKESVPGTMPKFEVGQVFVNPNGVECRITDVMDDVEGNTQVTYVMNDDPGTAYCGKAWSIENMLVKNSYVLQESSRPAKGKKIKEDAGRHYYVSFVSYAENDKAHRYPDLYVFDPEKQDWMWYGSSWGDYIMDVEAGKLDIGNIWCECHENDNPSNDNDQNEGWRQTCKQMEVVYPGRKVFMTLLPSKAMNNLYPYGFNADWDEIEPKIRPMFEKWRTKVENIEVPEEKLWVSIW